LNSPEPSYNINWNHNVTNTRRQLLRNAGIAAAVPSAFLPSLARAAEFTFKCGNDSAPTHPLNLRLKEAAARIREQTGGRFELQVFPNSQLGGQTDMLAQVRSGGLELAILPDLTLGTLAPIASINCIGFAFSSYDAVWRALDGDLGAHIRSGVNKAGLHIFDRVWDNGFRQVTSNGKPINTPGDLKGFKIRVPTSQLWVSMFKAFDAAPAALNSSELYAALQTRVVDGQENPLSNIFTQKTFEVQKYCSLTNHMWSGFWPVTSQRTWAALPPDIQRIVMKNFNDSALEERSDVEKLNATLEQTLTEKGLVFSRPDLKPFRETLTKAGFYSEWRKKFGDESWAILAKYANGVA
jgi:tripartite ATP-independent transporter DctP family solute receptor